MHISAKFLMKIFAYLIFALNILCVTDAAAQIQSRTYLAISPNPIIVGSEANVYAFVEGDNPAGEVAFYDRNDVEVGRAELSNGLGKTKISIAGGGIEYISARYLGDHHNSSSLSSKVALNVVPKLGDKLNVSPSAVPFGQSRKMVVSEIDKSVTWIKIYRWTEGSGGPVRPIADRGSADAEGAPTNGEFHYNSNALMGGAEWLYAEYKYSDGTVKYSPWVIVDHNPDPTTKSDVLMSAFVEESVIEMGGRMTVVVQVLGDEPSGKVMLYGDAITSKWVELEGGVAKYTLDSVPTYTNDSAVAVSYLGDAKNEPAHATTSNYKIKPILDVSVSELRVSNGGSTTFSVKLIGPVVQMFSPGLVYLVVDGVEGKPVRLTPLNSYESRAELIFTPAKGSENDVYIIFKGNERMAPASSAPFTVVSSGKDETGLILDASPAFQYVGEHVRLTARVFGPNPSGYVNFKMGTLELGRAALINGVASLDFQTKNTGVQEISADYLGDSTHDASSSYSFYEVKDKIPTTTQLKIEVPFATVGQYSKFEAVVSGPNPSGYVSFKDGGKELANASLVNGIASASVRLPDGGLRAITAEYSGDSSHATSTSSSIAMSVVNPLSPSTSFEVLRDDANTDGCDDYMVVAKIGSLVSPLFLLLSGNQCEYKLHSDVTAQQLSYSWVPANYSAKVSRRGGVFSGVVLIPGGSQEKYVFNILHDAAGYYFFIGQALPVETVLRHPGEGHVSLEDVDDDGRTDLMILDRDHQVINVFALQQDGKFSLSGAANDAAAASTVWRLFHMWLTLGQAERALSYVEESIRGGVRDSMSAPGADVRAFAASVKGFDILDESVGSELQGAVRMATPMGEQVYLIGFSKCDDGVWRIVSF